MIKVESFDTSIATHESPRYHNIESKSDVREKPNKEAPFFSWAFDVWRTYIPSCCNKIVLRLIY